MDKVKRYTSIDRPVAKYSEAGEHIYEWEYIDKEGKIKKDKKNIYEEIQSFYPRVDYKSQIARGELDLYDSTLSGVHKDFTGLPDDTINLYKHLSTLANLSQEQITNLLEQINAGDQKSVSTKQTTNSQTIDGGQKNQQDVQGKSTNGTIDTNINRSGEQE